MCCRRHSFKMAAAACYQPAKHVYSDDFTATELKLDVVVAESHQYVYNLLDCMKEDYCKMATSPLLCRSRKL